MKITDLYQELTEISSKYQEKSHITVAQKEFMDGFLDAVQNGVADLSPTQNILYAATTGLHDHIDLNLLHLDAPFMKKYIVEAKTAVLTYLEKKQKTLKRYGDVEAAMAGVGVLDYRLEKRIERELRQEVRSLNMSNRAKDKAEVRALKQKAEVKERLQGTIKRKDKKVRQLKQDMVGLEEQVDSYKSEVEIKVKEVRELEVTVKKVTGNADQVNAQVKSLQEKVKELEKNYAALNKTYTAESKSYKATIERQRTKITKYEAEITKQKSSAKKYRASNTQKNKEIKQIKGKLTAKNKANVDLKKEKKSLEVTLKKTEKEVEKAKAEILEKSATIRSIKGKAGYYERERKKTEKELDSLKKTYDKDILEIQKTVDVLEQSKTELEKKLEERKGDAELIKKLQEDNSYLQEEADKVKQLQGQLKEAEKKYTSGDSQKVKDLEKEIAELKRQNVDYKKQVEEHEKQHEADAKFLEDMQEQHENDIEDLVKKQLAEPEKPVEPENPAEPEKPAQPEESGLKRPYFPEKGEEGKKSGMKRPYFPGEGIEDRVDDKQKPGANITNIDALYDLHALVYSLSENGSTAEKRKAYETFLKYATDPVVKAEVLNNLACIYSQVDNDPEKAKDYFAAAVTVSEKAAELELDITPGRMKDYRDNLYICEEKIRFKSRPAYVPDKRGAVRKLINKVPGFRKKAV